LYIIQCMIIVYAILYYDLIVDIIFVFPQLFSPSSFASLLLLLDGCYFVVLSFVIVFFIISTSFISPLIRYHI
jgi:hypothetical protein